MALLWADDTVTWRGVKFPGMAGDETSAPFSSNTSINIVSPMRAASCSGVPTRGFTLFTSVPSAMLLRMRIVLRALTALCSGYAGSTNLEASPQLRTARVKTLGCAKKVSNGTATHNIRCTRNSCA